VKVALLPKAVEARLRSIHWYRKYGDRLVQELRLVPSNVRVYFHSRSTVGNDPGRVFDLYSIDSAAKAHQFETNFVRSGMALLTLFARTLTWDPARGRYSGLDFQDVWLDKDAILAPDGTVFFVDLEGIDLVSVEREGVREKMEDQIFRSLYEFMFAYEQIEGERERRFGSVGSRKRWFEPTRRRAASRSRSGTERGRSHYGSTFCWWTPDMTNCKQVYTFLNQISAKNVTAPLSDTDAALLSQRNLVQFLTKTQYLQLQTDVQALGAEQQAIAQEAAQRSGLAREVQDESRKTHSVLFRLEGKQKRAAKLQQETSDEARLKAVDGDLVQKQQQFGQLVSQRSLLDTITPCGDQYVGLTGLGAVELRNLGVRLYRV